MYKRSIVFLAVLFLFVLGFTTQGHSAFWGGKTANAKELIQEAENLLELSSVMGDDLDLEAGKKLASAHKLLISELSEDPDNLEALYALGKCAYYLGSQDSAYNKFQKTFQKDAEYGTRILNFYMKQADRYKSRSDLERSIELKLIAARFQRSKGDKIVGNILSKGKEHLNRGDFKRGHTYLETLRKYHSGYESRVAQAYFSAGKKHLQAGKYQTAHECFGATRNITRDFDSQLADLCYEQGRQVEEPMTALMLYDWSVMYNQKHKQAIMEKLKPMVKELGSESLQNINHFPSQDRAELRKAALNYKVYGPNSDPYYFKAEKVGRESPHYIRVKRGTIARFQSKYGNYIVITRSKKNTKRDVCRQKLVKTLKLGH